MKAKKYFLSGLVLVLLPFVTLTQTKDVYGVVLGIDGVLKKAKVEVLNTDKCILTNENGEFLLKNLDEKAVLEFSYKGLKKDVVVKNIENNQKICLIPNEKKLYRKAMKKESLEYCNIYIKNYPNGKDADNVKCLREKFFFIQAYEIAAEKFTDTALQNYLTEYPNGKYTTKVNEAIEITAWQKAKNTNTIKAYENYLGMYPNGIAVKYANSQIASLK